MTAMPDTRPPFPVILDGAENSNDAAKRRLFRIFADRAPLEALAYREGTDAANEAAIAWGRSILRGDEGSAFPPNIIHKRLSHRAFQTKSEDRSAALDFMRINGLREWTRQTKPN